MNDLSPYIYEYDFSFFHIQNEYKLSEEFCVEDYLYGRCHIFALELSKNTNLKVGVILDNEPFHDTGGWPSLEHAFCYLNEDLIIDARGISRKDDIIQEYGSSANDIVILNDAKEFLKQWIKKKLLDKSTPVERKIITDYIKEMHNHKLLSIPDTHNKSLKM